MRFEDYPECSLNFGRDYWKGKVYTFLHDNYDWVDDGGYNNVGNWIEEAAK